MSVMTPNSQPFDKVRQYFGEKITLFFEFRAHLTEWLFPAAIIGKSTVTLSLLGLPQLSWSTANIYSIHRTSPPPQVWPWKQWSWPL